MRCMEVSELVRSLLAKRGVESADDIAAFLNPEYGLHTHDPFLLEGMDVAVARLLLAIAQNERIAVYADFDCDGIPGAAVLSDFFRKIKYENFEVYLPHRDREGYGFHTAAIAELAKREVKLIVTVDVGTTAVEAVAFAKEKGVDVIVTDHHEIPGALPEAVAVLNPKLGSYPFPHLCGAAFPRSPQSRTAGKSGCSIWWLSRRSRTWSRLSARTASSRIGVCRSCENLRALESAPCAMRCASGKRTLPKTISGSPSRRA